MNNQEVPLKYIGNMECHALVNPHFFLFTQLYHLLNIFLGNSSSEVIILWKILRIIPQIIVGLIIP